MSIVVIDGLDIRTSSDIVKNYCQNYGRVINCYIKSNQCLVTFANKKDAEEMIRTSPHRIDSNGLVCASWKTVAGSHSTSEKRPINPPTDHCRLTVRGTSEQLEEKTLLRYFARFGHIRMCVSHCSQGFATITFDDRIGYGRALNESKHFLNGRSLIVERYDPESNKRFKPSSNEPDKVQSLNEQKRLENQYQHCVQAHEFEKKQWNDYLLRQQLEFQQQLVHYQQLLQQSLVEMTVKNKQIEQLKQENKDIE